MDIPKTDGQKDMVSEYSNAIKKTIILDGDTNYLLGILAATRGVSDSEYIRLIIREAVTPEVQALADSIRGKK